MDDRLRRFVPRQRNRDDADAGRTSDPARAYSEEVRRLYRREQRRYRATLLAGWALVFLGGALLAVIIVALIDGIFL